MVSLCGLTKHKDESAEYLIKRTFGYSVELMTLASSAFTELGAVNVAYTLENRKKVSLRNRFFSLLWTVFVDANAFGSCIPLSSLTAV